MMQKTFYKALIEVSLSPELVKKYFFDKRLTANEKKILECFLLIRNNKNNEAFSQMKELPPSEFPFVEAQRNLLMGLALNNQSHFKEAEEHLWMAIPVFKELHSHYFHFMSYFNLCMIALATNTLEKIPGYLAIMESIPSEHEVQHLRLLRCKFNYYAEVNEVENAQGALFKLQKLKSSMPESDIISHLVCEFMFYVSIEDYDHCHKVLTEMKNHRKFHLTENYNFMKMMLNHLTQNAVIYLSDCDFSRIPLLYHQLKVIHAFEENNESEAKFHWSKLEEFLPGVHQKDFHYKGAKCLFSLCLDKHLKARTVSLTLTKNEELSYFDALYNLLVNSSGPLSKEYIYEFVWGDPPKEKDDLKKLGRLISRIRTEKGIEVGSRKGTYFLEKSVKKIKMG